MRCWLWLPSSKKSLFQRPASDLGSLNPLLAKLLADSKGVCAVAFYQEPTELGTTYYEGSKRILEQLENLELDIENRDDQPRGLLRISAPVMLGQALVLPIVIAFQRVHPELRIELNLSDRLVDLVEDQFDIAIRMTDAPPPSFVAKLIGKDDRVICASPAYLQSRGIPSIPSDLSQHDGIHLSLDRLPFPFKLCPDKNTSQASDYILSSRIRLNTTEGIRQAALAGLGIADLPQYLVETDLKCGHLVAILTGFQPRPRRIWTIYPPSRFLPKKVTEFVLALQAGFTR
jgi:LysR family transcriptional activator of dmlA